MQTVEAGGLPIGDQHPTRIMGIVNLSEESPYDPSVFTDPGAAAEYVDEQLIAAGAEIVDVGLESANKRFEVLSAAEERDRLEQAFAMLDAVEGEAVFSIETRYASVADAALAAGFDLVNDICGFADPDMPAVCAEHGVPVVKMAGPGELERPGALATVEEIYDALAADPLPEQTIVDPAFGGWSSDKTVAADRETFRRLREFRALKRPMLVSINRKNFLRHLAERSTEEALPVSLAATTMAVERGANVIRTHDVAETRDAAIIGDAFTRNRLHEPELGIVELDVTRPAELRRHLERIGASAAAASDFRGSVYELHDLDEVDRRLLAHLAADRGGRFVHGHAKDVGILIASPRELRRLQAVVAPESTSLAAIFEAIDPEG